MNFSLTASIDDVVFNSLYESTSFREFCSDLDELDSLFDSTMYLEAVTQGSYGWRKDAGKVYSNTMDTIKTTSDIYRYTTDAGGGILAALWKLGTSACKLVARAARWIFFNIDKIPLFFAKVIDGIAEIPANIKNKIRGNIKLYITADDIVHMYSIPGANRNDTALFARLERIINELKELRKGDMWTTYWTNKTKPEDFFHKFGEDFLDNKSKHSTDMSKIKSVAEEFRYIKNVKFDKTVVDMNNPDIVDIYFGSAKKISYVDPRGVRKQGSYLESLKNLLDYIADCKEEINDLSKDIGNKFVQTETNMEFAKMGKHAQNTVVNFMQTISKLIDIMGNITRYAMDDVKTIEKSVNQMKAAATMSKGGKLEEDDKDSDELAEDKKAKRELAIKYYSKHPIKKLMKSKKTKKLEKLEKERKEALGDDDFKMVYNFGRSDIKNMTDAELKSMATVMKVNIEAANKQYNDAWNSEDWITIPKPDGSDNYDCMVKDYVRSCDRVIKLIEKEQNYRKKG